MAVRKSRRSGTLAFVDTMRALIHFMSSRAVPNASRTAKVEAAARWIRIDLSYPLWRSRPFRFSNSPFQFLVSSTQMPVGPTTRWSMFDRLPFDLTVMSCTQWKVVGNIPRR